MNKSISEARALLKKAISLHKGHIDGKVPTSESSQMKLMGIMENALSELGEDKSISFVGVTKMMGIDGADYARQEAWDCHDACQVLSYVCMLCMNEVHEPDDMNSLANIMRGLMEFINGEIADMVNAAKQGDSYEGKSSKVPAEVNTTDDRLNLSYVKSLGIDIPENKLAVKYVGKNIIAHPVFIWGDMKKTDLEAEFFTRESDFWDTALKDAQRFLTWEHGQDDRFASFESNPVIGKTVKFYDDDVARWAESVIETDKKYRKYIDQFIEEKRLGYSSDSAPQYVQRVKQGKATWLKSWPWFGGSLTAAPCEPRMKEFTPEFLKSLGIAIPENPKQDWEAGKAILDYFKIKYQIGD